MPDHASLLPCRRPELVSRPLGTNGSYLVRNRRAGQSFKLGQAEHFLLARLDGTHTVADLCADFRTRFGEPLTDEELRDFLTMARERELLQPSDTAMAVPVGFNGFQEDHQPCPGKAREDYYGQRGGLMKRFGAGILVFVAAVLQRLADLLSAAAHHIHWVRLSRLEFVPRPDDIFIVTYPRSGTTWMQMILYQLTTAGDMDIPHIYEYCPWFESSSRSRGGFEGRPAPRIFKSHLPYRKIPKGPCRYIYVCRGGKDVAVSYYHLYRSHNGYQGSFAEFFEKFMHGDVEFGSWFEHVKGWWRHRHDPNILFLHYEDLLRDLEGCLRKIIAFCGFDIAPERFPAILARCSFAFMKKHESQFDPLTGKWWEQGLQLKSFLRNGRAGAWQSELSPQQQGRFDRACQTQLGRGGITVGSDAGPGAGDTVCASSKG